MEMYVYHVRKFLNGLGVSKIAEKKMKMIYVTIETSENCIRKYFYSSTTFPCRPLHSPDFTPCDFSVVTFASAENSRGEILFNVVCFVMVVTFFSQNLFLYNIDLLSAQSPTCSFLAYVITQIIDNFRHHSKKKNTRIKF